MYPNNNAESDANDLPISNPTAAATNSPTVTFKAVTFSDDTTIELEPTDVVVLVGPNNAGKSEALRELEAHLSGPSQARVIKSVDVSKSGDTDDFSEFVRRNLRSEIQNGSHRYYGYDFNLSIGSSELSDYWPGSMDILRPLFCKRLLTERRITDSNAANSIDPLNDPPTHPIHLLFLNDKTELRLSEFFRLAFDEDLIVDRLGGRVLPLLTGDRPTPNYGEEEDRISISYIERLRATTVPLQNQGDGMRSFATVILHLLAPVTPSILLLDEPEAFLHPPQAKLIGQIIGEETSERGQLFVATHSPDVLQGLVDSAADRLRILRIQRSGSINHVTELSKDLVRSVSGDSLLKYSSVLSGVFHERVIVCEADADCLFYNSILGVEEVHGGHHPDVLFVHGGSRDRMDRLTETLVALGVDVDVISDIDIIRDLPKFRNLVDALRGDWPSIEGLAKVVKAAVESRRISSNAADMRNDIRSIVDHSQSIDQSPRQLEERIRALFRQASPWQAVKDAGKGGIPKGQASSTFEDLIEHCKQFRLWIVPVGELEGFCRRVGGHGPRWVSEVLANYEVETAPDLEDARDFIREIWRG